MLGPIVIAVTVLGSSGCTSGVERHPQPIADEAVPFDLLEGTAPPEPSSQPDGLRASVFLVRDHQLVEVERELPPDATPTDIVRTLGAGPTADEASTGLTSSVPDPTAIRDVTVVRGVAEVDLARGFSDLDGEAQATAIAQIVFTLTGRPGVGRVAFAIDGATLEVPRGDGTLSDGALARDDFPDALETS